MSLTFKAACYLHAFDNRLPIQNGLAFENELRQCQLDYSVQSLGRIDKFLDDLRKSGRIREDNYLDHPASQNLLYLLAFYVGEVIARSLRSQPHWYTYDEISERDAGSHIINGRVFENSATLAFPDCPQVATKTFLPLVSITSRLFSEFVEKSVLFSAGFLLPAESEKEPLLSQPLAPPPAPPWPLDVATLLNQREPGVRARLEMFKPSWVDGDELRYLFDNAQALLREGRVVWGALVQANKMLFAPEPQDLRGAPGEVLYDPLGRIPPEDLQDMARVIASLKGRKLDDPDLAYFSKYLADERIRVFGIDVPSAIVPYPFKVSSTYFDRQFLPGGMLAKSVIPLLISDAHPGAAMPLPMTFWPPGLRQEWLQACPVPPGKYLPDPELAHLHPMSLTEEGLIWFKGGDLIEKNNEKARQVWERAAQAGSASALYGLGTLYEEGLNGEPDLQRALSYFQSAVEKGDKRAQASVARIRRRLDGGAPEEDAAETIRTISMDIPDILYREGMAYFEGRGVIQSYERAREIWKRAANSGHAQSIYSLGTLYYNGQGGPADMKLAISYISRAAERGYDLAQLQMGRLHLQESSNLYSRKDALHWLKLAADQGNEQAQDLLKQNGLQETQNNTAGSRKNIQEVLEEWEEQANQMADEGWEKSEIEADLKDQGCTPRIAAEAVRRAMSRVRAGRRRKGLMLIGLGCLIMLGWVALVMLLQSSGTHIFAPKLLLLPVAAAGTMLYGVLQVIFG